jgi:isoquinoline 1-oxidoreductase
MSQRHHPEEPLPYDPPQEVERYELRAPPTYRFEADRREFVHVLGAGLVVACAASTARAQPAGRQRRGSGRRAESLAARLHVAETGQVTLFTSKVEVGQGSRTQLTQAAAEELRLPVERITCIMADTRRCPDDGGTAGSRTTPSTVPAVRQACAAARERFIELAAGLLAVEPSRVQFDDGVFAVPGGASVTLGKLAAAQEFVSRLKTPVQDAVEVRHVEQWTVLGTSVAKVAGREMVTGAHRYPSDIQLPGMWYGKVLRGPSTVAKLTSIDLAPGRAIEGVRVVRDGEFVGCVAATSWQAAKAVDAIAATCQWEQAPGPSSHTLVEHFKKTADSAGGQRGRRGDDAWGDPDAALAAAAKRFSASYVVPYIQHAPMEPRAAVAQWQAGELTVWTGTQQPARVHSELQQAFRLAEDQVRVIVPDTGGGFGGKHTGEAAVEAARLAQSAGCPVSLRWTREEEFTWAYFRPAGIMDVQAGIDHEGQLTAWRFTNINSGGSALATPYRVANGRTEFLTANSPLRQGSYRALASTANTFAREAAMDELAELAGADPLDFRLAHLDEGRLRDVLHAVTERFEWRVRRQQGHHVGLACGTEKGSYVAACAEVEVVDGKIRVLSVCQAYECGAIHNPANLQSQVAGAIVMGLGGALMEEIEFENGRIINPDFSSYQVPRMQDVPELDIVLLNRHDLPSVGGGETPIIAVAPAIANAVYVATGSRCRSLPLRPHPTPGGK